MRRIDRDCRSLCRRKSVCSGCCSFVRARKKARLLLPEALYPILAHPIDIGLEN